MPDKKYYYQVSLELLRKDPEEIFGFVNISHISYEKLYELFADQMLKEKFLFDDVAGYHINEELYFKHKDFFDKEIPFKFDFNLFDYWVGLSGDELHKYKKDYYTEWPPAI